MKKSLNLKERLKFLVEKLKKSGLPPNPSTIDNAFSVLKPAQLRILFELMKVITKIHSLILEKVELKEGNELWQLWTKANELCARAALGNMLNIRLVQYWAVYFGALPDPKWKWKYYRRFDNTLACWQCDSIVQNNPISVPAVCITSDPRFEKCRVEVPRPYCPKCEKRDY